MLRRVLITTMLATLVALLAPGSATADGPCMLWRYYWNNYLIGTCVDHVAGPFPSANFNAPASTAAGCEALNQTDARSCENKADDYCVTRSGSCLDFFWYTGVNGDGVCDGSQESGQNAPYDCCDQWTSCSATFKNQGTKWCRQFAWCEGFTCSAGPYLWLSDATPYCDETAEIDHRYTKCALQCARCSAIPNVWTSDSCYW